MFDLEAFRLGCLNDALVQNVWHNKYRFENEVSISHSKSRVVQAVYAKSDTGIDDALWAVLNGYFLPAGRQNAGAGTNRMVTLNNCYVGEPITDSMPGIQRAIANAAFTLQQGGGIGHDFTTIRPSGALVKRTGSVASGPIEFMHQMSAMSESVCSAGERRGAMMMTLSIDHPDVWHEDQWETRKDYVGDLVLRRPSFISVKRQKGRLTQTNISVLVSDAFMKALANDEPWDLGHFTPRADSNHVEVYEKPFPYDYVELNNRFQVADEYNEHAIPKGKMQPWYVYKRVPARRIWDDLLHATYKYAEPGVIFIDRVNHRNNLYYCEDIRSTNPCGEQPLPPWGCCTLGSINLAFMVKNPFTAKADFNLDTFKRAVHVGVRFLDNVLDVTHYPLQEQKYEAESKRRIGLGLTGLADALIQLGHRYGDKPAQVWTRWITSRLQEESYKASAMLAKERGPFPFYKADKFFEGFNVRKLSKGTLGLIESYGIRNGVLNTEAPNGTISIYSGNTGQGIEPVFAFQDMTRKVRQPDGTLLEMTPTNYSLRLFNELKTQPDFKPVDKDVFVSALQLTPRDHVLMQAACQEHIDASISKTVNCPTAMTFEEFREVYDLGWQMGCKGLTTYRDDPESGRGSVLTVTTPTTTGAQAHPPVASPQARERVDVKPPQRVVEGRRYRLKWPPTGENFYVTITRHEGVPFEVFITPSNAAQSEWIQALSRLLTAVLRRGGDVRFLVNELEAVYSSQGGAAIAEQKRFRPSVIAAIGGILEEEFRTLGLYGQAKEPEEAQPVVTESAPGACPECGATPLVHEEGCVRCLVCSYYKCG